MVGPKSMPMRICGPLESGCLSRLFGHVHSHFKKCGVPGRSATQRVVGLGHRKGGVIINLVASR